LSGKGGNALKLLDKIWNILGLVETEDAEEPKPAPADKTSARSERKNERLPRTVEDNKPRWSPPTESLPASPAPSLPAKTKLGSHSPPELSEGKGKVVITQPTGFDDARQIAENLSDGKTIVVNFERSDGETTKRTVDFMSGITYALGGTVQRISSTIFLFAPSHVEVLSSERHGDEEPGVLPWR
jgi:cell division inhibitor SepF